MGLSDFMLPCQRRAALAACCGSPGGANLDLSLAFADGDSKGAADPAFEAHCGVVHFWALALWDARVPGVLLQRLVDFAISRIGSARTKWG
jgi:hypothetical protein